MSADDELSDLAELCGIVTRYHDLQGQGRAASPDTLRALLRANGVDASSEAAIRDAHAGLRAARDARWFPEEVVVESLTETPLSFGLGARWALRDVDTDIEAGRGVAEDAITLPPLASGLYDLTAEVADRSETTRIVAAPKRLPLLQDATGQDRIWGINLALYGLRSGRNAGLGDFGDLAEMARMGAGHGAGFIGVNPLHNIGFSSEAISPYSPSHRGFLNAGHIALDQIPGLMNSDATRRVLQQAGTDMACLRGRDRVAYPHHKQLHQGLLEKLYVVFGQEAADKDRLAFEDFATRGGAELAAFARFETHSENAGPDWRGWTSEPGSAEQRDRFHIWLQWVAEAQLAKAQKTARAEGMALGLYLDLAVGPRRDGAESWCEREAIAEGVSIGAPPDHLSPEGQNWDLAAYSPRKLQARNYRAFRNVLAAAMRHAGMLRIDHVLGLNRSFWLPDDGSPGSYVRQPFETLLAIIKIEAERCGTVIVGEDLGLVPDGFRDTMRAHGFYGYSVAQFERDHEGRLGRQQDAGFQVLSCFATHDTPTVRGFEIGRDIDWWRRLGWTDDATTDAARDRRRQDVDDLKSAARAHDFSDSVHDRLARSPAALVTVQLDDIREHEETQNLPGTIDEHPNWRRKYDTPVEELAEDGCLATVAAMMAENGRANRQNRKKEMFHEG